MSDQLSPLQRAKAQSLASGFEPEPSLDQYRRAWRLLEMVAAEWKTEPMAVQCFDLRIVRETLKLMEEPRI